MTQQAQPLLDDQQYKDLIVFQAHQHFEAIKIAGAHAQQSVNVSRANEALSGQLKQAQEELSALKALPVADAVPAPEATAEPAVSTDPLPVVDA